MGNFSFEFSCFILIAEMLVGLESMVYTTREDNEDFVICAVVYNPDIDCPAVFPFELRIEAIDGTASMQKT